ncbi:MAG: glycosyltransferase [Atopobiaceae bacterium]|nr:glycosyltransferase [Atopobiaceae bacterium]
MNQSVAILVPCYNEELTVAKVIDDFRRELPDAVVYVYDNNSSDRTAQIARDHGAVVVREPRQGKGNVVRQMLRDIDADCYVLVDGDDTYPAEAVHALIAPVLSGEADHVVGDRISGGECGSENKRAFHGFGNGLVRWLIQVLYGFDYDDVMTGYRAFSRAFAKTYPVLSPGFEVETELSIHAVDKRWRIAQVPIAYRDRPEGSVSKLNTISDGNKVLRMIFSLFKDYKPLGFFSLLSAVSLAIGLILGLPVVFEFYETGLVPRFPTAILAVAFCGLAALLFTSGLILDTVVKGNRRSWEIEVMRLMDEERTKKS